MGNGKCCIVHISIHAPRGGSDFFGFIVDFLYCISIHAPRGGSDIQFTLVNGVATYISIHAPRGGSDSAERQQYQQNAISIHAPRGGSDHRKYRWLS